MQNTEKSTSKDKAAPKRSPVKQLFEKLKSRDEVQVRSHLRLFVDFLLVVAVGYMLGGAMLLFATYPLCIALLSSKRGRLLPISLGLIILFALGRLPITYIFTCISIPLIRILITYIPLVFSELARASAVSNGGACDDVIEYNPYLPEKLIAENKEGTIERLNDEKYRLANIFNEPLLMRALSSALGGLIAGILLLIGTDFSFYSLCGAFFLTFFCPTATVILSLAELSEKTHIKQILSLISTAAICSGCIYAAKSMSVIGMPMAPFLSLLLTLYFTSEHGALPGAVSAVIFGLILDPVYMPLLLICSFLFFLISTVKHGAGLAVVCAAVVVWCYYVGGTSGLVGILPPMFLSIPVYMIIDKYRHIMHAPYDKSAVLAGGIYFAEAVTEKNKNVAVRERLGALSEAFSVLSDTFYKLSDKRRRPDMLGIKNLCEKAFDLTCEGCKNREICYGNEYKKLLDSQGRITSALHSKGNADVSDLDPDLIKLCPYTDKLIENINSAVSEVTEKMIKNGNLGFFASSYEDINEILKDALENDSEEYATDSEAAEKILDMLSEQGFIIGGVVVYGKRCRNIAIKGLPSQEKLSAGTADLIRRSVGEAVGSELGDPIFEVGRDGAILHLTSRPLYRARCAYGRIAADRKERMPSLDMSSLRVDPFDGQADEGVCGDTANCFITGSSYFYSLISDGMGCGEEAAFVSGVCSMFIEKMLSAGNRADITLRMLNNVLRNENIGSGGECSATIDLCEFDLISGTASFIKSGAAPTYIARGGTVYKVYSRTMPIGILKETDTKISKFDTKKGDLIVMLSDGCCPDSEDCPWLVEFLCEYMSRKEKNALGNENECENLKDKLLSLAVKNFPAGKPRDDISVSVIMVE